MNKLIENRWGKLYRHLDKVERGSFCYATFWIFEHGRSVRSFKTMEGLKAYFFNLELQMR